MKRKTISSGQDLSPLYLHFQKDTTLTGIEIETNHNERNKSAHSVRMIQMLTPCVNSSFIRNAWEKGGKIIKAVAYQVWKKHVNLDCYNVIKKCFPKAGSLVFYAILNLDFSRSSNLVCIRATWNSSDLLSTWQPSIPIHNLDSPWYKCSYTRGVQKICRKVLWFWLLSVKIYEIFTFHGSMYPWSISWT